MIVKNSMKHYYLKKKTFSHLNMEDVTDADYAHAKENEFKEKNLKNFKIRNLEEYHDLYFQGNTVLLGDVFENLKKYVY